MSNSKDESQSTQENKTPPAKQENTPQQAGEKEAKPKQSQQVTNDIKWVPFLIVFHLVAQALNRLSLRRPSAPRQEEREDENKRWHGISDKTLHRSGNIGLIVYQALLFFLNNFSVTFDSWVEQVPLAVRIAGVVAFCMVLLLSVCAYFFATDGKKSLESFISKPPMLMSLLAFIVAVSVIPSALRPSSTEWKWVKLLWGTFCQGAAGYVAWKAADLIPTPSAGNSKEPA